MFRSFLLDHGGVIFSALLLALITFAAKRIDRNLPLKKENHLLFLHSRVYTWFFLFGAIFFFTAMVWSALDGDYWISPLFFLFGAPPLLLFIEMKFFKLRLYDSADIEVQSLLQKNVVVNFDQVEKVLYNSLSGKIILHSQSGDKIRISTMLPGRKLIYKLLITRMPENISSKAGKFMKKQMTQEDIVNLG